MVCMEVKRVPKLFVLNANRLAKRLNNFIISHFLLRISKLYMSALKSISKGKLFQILDVMDAIRR